MKCITRIRERSVRRQSLNQFNQLDEAIRVGKENGLLMQSQLEVSKRCVTVSEHYAFSVEPTTLRDQFAMSALQGMLAENGGGAAGNDDLACISYAVADAMMKEREKA